MQLNGKRVKKNLVEAQSILPVRRGLLYSLSTGSWENYFLTFLLKSLTMKRVKIASIFIEA